MHINDRGGLEGMPLKLVIVSLMISICTPVLSTAIRSFEEGTSAALVEDTLEKIQEIAEEVFVAGPGNSRCLNVHIPESPGLYLVIGGSTLWEQSSIGVYENGIEVERAYMAEPSFRFLTERSYGLVLETDRLITFTCIEMEGERFVEVSV